MDQLRPTAKRGGSESKTGSNLNVKFVKNNGNGNGIRVDSVDSR
jgi:hypothetical protein